MWSIPLWHDPLGVYGFGGLIKMRKKRNGGSSLNVCEEQPVQAWSIPDGGDRQDSVGYREKKKVVGIEATLRHLELLKRKTPWKARAHRRKPESVPPSGRSTLSTRETKDSILTGWLWTQGRPENVAGCGLGQASKYQHLVRLCVKKRGKYQMRGETR